MNIRIKKKIYIYIYNVTMKEIVIMISSNVIIYIVSSSPFQI